MRASTHAEARPTSPRHRPNRPCLGPISAAIAPSLVESGPTLAAWSNPGQIWPTSTEPGASSTRLGPLLRTARARISASCSRRSAEGARSAMAAAPRLFRHRRGEASRNGCGEARPLVFPDKGEARRRAMAAARRGVTQWLWRLVLPDFHRASAARRLGRAATVMDSKSIRLCPQGFVSPQYR